MDIKAQFERDAVEWDEESEYMSVIYDAVNLPSYQRIIALGSPAVPLMIDRLRSSHEHWFWALVQIVGEDKAAGVTTVPEAAHRWVEWYDREGYLTYGGNEGQR